MRNRKATIPTTPGPTRAETPGSLRVVEPPEGAIRLVWVDPSSLTLNPANWRIHPDEQKALVGDTIDDPGIRWAGACLYNERTGNLLDGHLRRDHAFNSRLPVPVLVGSWSPEKEAAIMAIIDQSTGMARTDVGKLLALVQRAAPPTERASEILRRLSERQGVVFPTDGDRPPTDDPGGPGGGSGDTSDRGDAKRQELLDKWAVEPGQLWHCQSKDGLRIHRIMCGDSTSDVDVRTLFAGKVADLVMTSPPYTDHRSYGGDIPPWDDLMRGAFAAIPAGPDTQIMVNLANTYQESSIDMYWLQWVNWMKSRGWRHHGWYIWDQKRGLPGDWHGRLSPSHEFIFSFNKNSIDLNKSVPCVEAGKVNEFTDYRTKGRETWRDGNQQQTADMKIHDSVFRVERDMVRGVAHLHPAVYPVALAAEVIACYGKSGDITYDPFGGSGATLLACESLGRTGYIMEIHPPYVSIALERLALSGLVPFQSR